MLKKLKTKFIKKIKNQKGNLNALAKIVALLLPFSILIYLGVKFYDAKHYEAVYEIDFNEENFKNTELPLYINELQNSPKFSYFEDTDDGTIAQVEGSPISFVFQPEEFPLNKNITVSMILQGDGDWDISLVCPNCEKEEKYDWKSFYQGSLSDYILAASFDGINIYAKEEKNFLPANSVEEWLCLNASANSSIEIKNEVFLKSKLVNPDIDFHKGEWTTMDKTIRGPHEFFVYLEGGLEMEVIKKDMNNYDGADAVRVVLYDLDDNLIGEDFLEDDGVEEKSVEFAPVVRKSIKIDIPNDGVYKLIFEEIIFDIFRKDWVITNFKINTNKIIFSNEKPTLFLDPVKLYTEIKHPTDININIWYEAQIQTTNFSSNSYNFNFTPTEDQISKKIIAPLNPENYKISFKGNQGFGGAYFSLNKNNYFQIYSYSINEAENPDFVISDYSYEKLDNWFIVKKSFTVLELEKLDELKSLTFQIKNSELYKQFKNENSLYSQGLNPLSQFNEFKLFGNKELKNTNASAIDLISWLKKSLPNGATLLLPDNLFLDEIDLNNNQITIIKDNKEDFDFALTENIIQNPILFKNIKIDVE